MRETTPLHVRTEVIDSLLLHGSNLVESKRVVEKYV